MREFTDNVYALGQIVKRCLKMFFKDGMSVFFSLLAPLIVFLLYVLFLGDIQVDSVMSSFPDGVEVSKSAVKGFVDSWMTAGVLGVGCITVSFSANSIMVQDKQRGKILDCLVSPVKRSTVTLAYFLFNYAVTVCICTMVYAVCLIYLAARGAFFLTAADVFAAFGIILYASLSSTLITVFVSSFVKTEAALGGLSGIISAAVGFLLGAYMPLSIFPKAIQYISCLLPGTHAAGMFRVILMNGALENLTAGWPSAVKTSLEDAFSLKIDFFGKNAGIEVMAIYVAVAIIVFLMLNVLLGTKLLQLSDGKKLAKRRVGK